MYFFHSLISKPNVNLIHKIEISIILLFLNKFVCACVCVGQVYTKQVTVHMHAMAVYNVNFTCFVRFFHDEFQ